MFHFNSYPLIAKTSVSLLLFTQLLFVLSCTDSSLYKDNLSSINRPTKIRSLEEAIEVVKQSLPMIKNYIKDNNIGDDKPLLIHKSDVYYITNYSTKSRTSGNDTILYVINFGEEKGFAIVSANPNVTGLLAISDTGSFNEQTIQENKGLNYFIELAQAYSKSGNNRLSPLDSIISTTLQGQVSPMIQVSWGQKFPEGLYCPNTIAGCANTAAIQIASYFECPQGLNLTFAQKDSDYINIDWTDIKLHVSGTASYSAHNSCLASIRAHKNIGRICRQFAKYANSTFKINGNSINSDSPLPYDYDSYVAYSNASTSTSESQFHNTFDSLGLSTTSNAYYSNLMVRYYLNKSWPIFMYGVTNNNKGHVWVVDGYRYYVDEILSHITLEPTIYFQDRYYSHVNWGWYGRGNGWFLDDVFSVANAYSYDNPGLNNNINYSFGNLIFFAVHQ